MKTICNKQYKFSRTKNVFKSHDNKKKKVEEFEENIVGEDPTTQGEEKEKGKRKEVSVGNWKQKKDAAGFGVWIGRVQRSSCVPTNATQHNTFFLHTTATTFSQPQ